MADHALADVKVLDLGRSIAGPFCAKLLADYGAEVIKVEPPGAGDPARQAGPFPADVADPEASGLFLHLNTNKLGVTLDIESPEGAGLLKRLVQGVDVVVENFHPDYLPSLGLGYGALAAVNPALVMTSITPFGQTGPYRGFKGSDLVIFAMSGRMEVHGLAERAPLRYAPDVATFQVGATAAMAAMGALFGARLDGEGRWVDLASVEALIGNADSRLLSYIYGEPQFRGHMWPGYRSGAYPCADGYVLFAGSGERFFRRLCRGLGMEELMDDPRWATPEARIQHEVEFDEILLPWLLQRTRREAFEAISSAGGMCAPLLTIDELFTDPQLEARRFFVEVDHAQAGRLTYPGAPFKMSETPWAVRRPAPLLGEHNNLVYRDRLGLKHEELARLSKLGII